MKTLYLIGGTMGIGKTSVSQCIKQKLPNAVFLDGDWCWDANPFQVTKETKEMVIDNICYLLNRFIQCSVYKNIIFCWVMHEQSIIDTILNKINTTDCMVKIVSLMANKETLAERIMRDIDSGIRDADVLKRSIARLPLYQSIDSVKVETDGKTVHEIAKEIIKA
ncbi:MAG: AAA family ATPase [Clostridiales bacterium]|nr:AAA family ATPase [Clostridiales bacterium]